MTKITREYDPHCDTVEDIANWIKIYLPKPKHRARITIEYILIEDVDKQSRLVGYTKYGSSLLPPPFYMRRGKPLGVYQMKQELVQLPEVISKEDLTLQPGLVYQVPDSIWVMDSETKELLDVAEITVAEAARVLLIPKVAGGQAP